MLRLEQHSGAFSRRHPQKFAGRDIETARHGVSARYRRDKAREVLRYLGRISPIFSLARSRKLLVGKISRREQQYFCAFAHNGDCCTVCAHVQAQNAQITSDAFVPAIFAALPSRPLDSVLGLARTFALRREAPRQFGCYSRSRPSAFLKIPQRHFLYEK
jgi:hypothetical protein